MKVNYLMNFLLMIILVFSLHIGQSVPCSIAQEVPTAKLPAMVTSCGQSPDAYMVRVLCNRVNIKVSYDPLLQAKDLKDVKTLLVVMGGSAKGLGEAGIDEKDELDRTRSLLAKAREQKVLILGIHVGGEQRRGPLSSKFIDLVSPRSDYLIVIEDGNRDGYFNKVSKEKKIPLILLKDTPDLGDILKRIFQMK